MASDVTRDVKRPGGADAPRANLASADSAPAGTATASEPSLMGRISGFAPGALPRADRRALAILAALIVASVALRLLTWDVIADGGQSRYVKTALFGGGAAAVVWALMRVQTGPSSWVPLIAAALVLASGDAVHYVRRTNPITRGAPIQSVDVPLTDEATARRQWDFELSGAARVRFEPGAVTLDSPPNSTAYMQGKLGEAPDARINWWLPVGLAERERNERLSWQATIRRTHGYYVVAEVRRLLIQVVNYGIHVTYPDEQNIARGHEIPHPLGSDGQPHEWQIIRDTRQIRLLVDGKEVWAAGQREALGQIKLGETKVDADHGGTMRVQRAVYQSFLERQ
ncbi:MAG: hypothetical protein M3442_21645 [Chloroflexota bacterium]|nr:hypothetical protein [Chloroflexota bacterium]